MRYAQRPADSEKTYGYHRAGTLAAYTNASVLVLLSLWLGYEALERFRSPVTVVESWMIWTSLAALAVNGGITLALVRGRGDLNLRSILIHNFGDALSNIAIIAGAVVIHVTGARWIDPLLGLAIGLLVLWSSIGILRESSHILLEGRPRELRLEEVARAMLTIEGVQEVHDVHLWSLGGGHHALSLHARIPDMHLDECEHLLASIKRKASQDFGIEHTLFSWKGPAFPQFPATSCPSRRRSSAQAGDRKFNPRCSLNCCVAFRSSVSRATLRRKPSLVTYRSVPFSHAYATAKNTVPSRRTKTNSSV
jgi:cobalt-zinc-cadmium efflux system protein